MRNLVWLVVAGAAAIILGGFYLVISAGTDPTQYDDFAKCLSERGFKMAGTDWCHYCQQQKGMFGNSFKHVDYRNCDIEQQFCEDQGVTGYPTWFGPDDTAYRGVQSLERLSGLSGCTME